MELEVVCACNGASSMEGRRLGSLERRPARLIASLAALVLLTVSQPDAKGAQPEGRPSESRPYQYLDSEPRLLFRYADPIKDEDRHVVRISKVAAREAASRRGALPVTLPDGVEYELKVLREEVAATGDWTLVASVDTPLGPQSAVITYGSDGAFGVLPTPDGDLWQISTSHGETVLEPAGGMVPEGMSPAEAAAADYIPAQPSGNTTGGTLSLPQTDSVTSVGTVEVNLLGIYTSDLVGMRGTVAAAETEFTNQVAIANQVFMDSGTTVRLRLIGLHETDVPAATSNLDALFAITNNTLPDGLDLHGLRDNLAADLVALLRPHRPTHGSCGVAWLNGANLNPLSASAEFGYSVNNVTPCGPFVLAHEVGHNLGSHHDIASAVDSSGKVGRGAFIFSYGYVRGDPPAFATVMGTASAAQKWLGQFSHPDTARCEGVPCGFAGEADNVRSIERMAPLIARFRDPPGTISVLDASIAEGDVDTSTMSFTVRLASPAPIGGVRFDIATADGTAIGGKDYLARSLTGQVIPEGERTYIFAVPIFGDLEEEPDEFFTVELSNVAGAILFAGSATGTIRNDDPKMAVSGRIRFGGGTTPPIEPISLLFELNDGYGSKRLWLTASPPDFRYVFPVARGTRVTANVISPPPPLRELSTEWGAVEEGLMRDITLHRTPRVSGRVILPAGVTTLPKSLRVVVWGPDGDPSRGTGIAVFPPDFRYDLDVKPGASVRLELDPSNIPPPFLYQPEVNLGEIFFDTSHDLTLERGATISGRITFPPGIEKPNEPTIISFFSPQGHGGRSGIAYPPDFRYSATVIPFNRYTMNVLPPESFVHFFEDIGIVIQDRDLDIPLRLVPSLSISDSVVSEGAAGTTMAEFVLSLSAPHPSGSVTASLSTRNGNAIASKDYLFRSETIVFHEGETRKTFSVPIIGNTTPEPDRVFFVDVESVHGATAINTQAAGVILDDDGGSTQPTLWVGDRTMQEGNRGQSIMRFVVALSRPAPQGEVRFDIATADGSAHAGSDYVARSQTGRTIIAGQTRTNFNILINGDTTPERDEAFVVEIGNVTGALVAKGQATGRIVNDDSPFAPVTANDHYFVEPGEQLIVDRSAGVLANDSHPTMAEVSAFRIFGNPLVTAWLCWTRAAHSPIPPIPVSLARTASPTTPAMVVSAHPATCGYWSASISVRMTVTCGCCPRRTTLSSKVLYASATWRVARVRFGCGAWTRMDADPRELLPSLSPHASPASSIPRMRNGETLPRA